MRPSALRVLPLALLSAIVSAQSLWVEVTKPIECSRKTQNGDKISVNYKGTLQSDGSEFDSSYGRGRPFTFTLGAGEVIKGWDEGLKNMCIGEGRRLTIPPGMAYGESGQGGIPGGSTLIFETELMGIEGVTPPPAPARPIVSEVSIPARPTIVRPEDSLPAEASAIVDENLTPTALPISPSEVIVAPLASELASSDPAKDPTTQASPMENNDNECHLLGSYALIVQGALGLLAVTALVFKRWRESPRRPLKIWFFDVSKQVFGSALLHLANVLMSMLSSGSFDVDEASQAAVKGLGNVDEETPNPCSFYLLNITIDTTIGIPILVLLLRILHALFLHTPLANPPESIRSGCYSSPSSSDRKPRVSWWLKQSIIYFLGLFGMKLCVFAIFQLLPWIAWVGDWALRWTEGNEALQITFVMFVFPLVMNMLQYWVIDGFIKDREGPGGGDYGRVGDGESEGEEDEEWLERHRRERNSGEGSLEGDGLEEANPTVVPVRGKKGGSGKGREFEYDPEVDAHGEGSAK